MAPYTFSDDFETGPPLGATWSNETAAVVVTPAAAFTGTYGVRQTATVSTAGVMSLSDTTLPDGYPYAMVECDVRQIAHTSGNSPWVTIQNRTGVDHADLFVNYTADGRLWWDINNANNAQAAITPGQYYHLRAVVYFGGTTWWLKVWLDGSEMPPVMTTGKTASDVRAIHFGGFGPEENTRDFDNVKVTLSMFDPSLPLAPKVPVFLPGVPVGQDVVDVFNTQVRDPLAAILKPPNFRARRTTALTVAEGTTQALTWNQVDEDPYGGWAGNNSPAEPTKWIVPPGWYGWWQITAAVSLFGTGAAGLVVIPSIAVNAGAVDIGVIYEGQEVFVPTSTSSAPKLAASSWWVYAGEGDFIELQLWYSTESAITAVDTTAGFECRLELIWDGV
ncbi:hypothetical protein [Spirillospora sp. CA-128828]|uniref:hypothetical protein n=1 Tax=Spirillospora sp. CA-128828 TaxID=3240033 RepID=UPI003D8BAE32